MNKQEYEEKFQANAKLTGFGVETTQHMPCPACAEADFAIYRILDVQAEFAKEHVCKYCGIGIIAVFHPDRGGVSFEFLQTKGPNLPDFLPPIKRRES